MTKMALLISTDDWSKLTLYQNFLCHNAKAVWRTRGKNKQDKLNQIPLPINLYFFHRNVVKYQARCTGIFRTDQWPWEEIPSAFHASKIPFTIFIQIDTLSRIDEIPITEFPKWDNPKECFIRGQLGLLKVVDIYATR
jgi:hypothetical protein